MDIVTIGNVPIQDLTYEETLERIEEIIGRGRPGRMVVTNASKTVLAQTDEALRRFIQTSDIVTADGMSVVWAARFLGAQLRERVTGIDTMERLVEAASNRGFKVFFLGAKQEVVERVALVYSERYPNLAIAGFHHGYVNGLEKQLAETIRAAAPDILFVAMGSPAQEFWIERNQEPLGVPFCLGVGGSFDHVIGASRRAPVWMQRVGLEWLYRLMTEPRRLWKRYLVGNTKFIALVLRERLAPRTRQPSSGLPG